MARRITVQLGYDDVPGPTVNQFCASVQTARMAFHAIKAGEGDVFVSAGVECVSRYTAFGGAGVDPAETQNPLFADAQAAPPLRGEQRDLARPAGRWRTADIYIQMGQTAEHVATLCGITRPDQDEFGSSRRTGPSRRAGGFFAREITPITLSDGVVDTDDGPRPGTTYEGSPRAGRCSPRRHHHGRKLLSPQRRSRRRRDHVRCPGAGPRPDNSARPIVATATSASSPEIMGLGPVEATGGCSPEPE